MPFRPIQFDLMNGGYLEAAISNLNYECVLCAQLRRSQKTTSNEMALVLAMSVNW